MAIYALADLHLPGGEEKPMEVFGSQWNRHFDTICEQWHAVVRPEDAVLIPGDISWAMQLSAAQADLLSIDALPGRKVLLKGNHDYWWSSLSKVRSALPAGMQIVQNDSVELPEAVVAGSRGWTLPTAQQPLPPEDEKIFQRELLRLELSLRHARERGTDKPLVAMLHFPPLYADGQETAVTALLERYGVTKAVYGHLHGPGIKNGWNGPFHGVEYLLVSCDAVDFCPQMVISGN